MSILQSTQEPRDGASVVAQALEQLHTPAAGQPDLRSLNPIAIQRGWHHAVYDLDAKTLAAGGNLEPTQRKTSRYLLRDASSLRGAIEIATDPKGASALDFMSLNQGPFVQGTAAAISVAEAELDDEICTFSVLRISPLKVWLLRVKPNDPSQALRFYAIAPVPSSLHSDRRYFEDDLLAVLQPMARDLFKPQSAAAAGDDDLSD